VTTQFDLAPGAKWEHVSPTRGVTLYEIDRVGPIDSDAAAPIRLRNVETGGLAQVWARSLIRPLGPEVPHWRPA
jgi:hypothetical protein